MRERKATDGKGKTLMRKRDYFQIKLTDDNGETYYFKHYTMESPELITGLEENAGVVGDYELRAITDELVSLGWRRDQMTFICVGGVVEGGPVPIP